MGVTKSVGTRLAPKIPQFAPQMSTAVVNQALDRAILGVGPLPGAAEAATKQLEQNHGHLNRGIHDVIENHVRYAGLQGFVTNLGGLVTMTVTVPTNLVGVAVLQARMVAGILHLRGYDLAAPTTRSAILASLLGEEKVLALLKAKKLPGTPSEIADNPVLPPGLDQFLAAEVATELISRALGKRLATTVGRRVPIVGGAVGAGTDAYATWKIGRYVDREFLPRTAAKRRR